MSIHNCSIVLSFWVSQKISFIMIEYPSNIIPVDYILVLVLFNETVTKIFLKLLTFFIIHENKWLILLINQNISPLPKSIQLLFVFSHPLFNFNENHSNFLKFHCYLDSFILLIFESSSLRSILLLNLLIHKKT